MWHLASLGHKDESYGCCELNVDITLEMIHEHTRASDEDRTCTSETSKHFKLVHFQKCSFRGTTCTSISHQHLDSKVEYRISDRQAIWLEIVNVLYLVAWRMISSKLAT